MVGVSMHHLVTGFEVDDIFFGTQGSANHICQLIDGVRNICTNVNNLVDCFRKVYAAGDMWGNIINVLEIAKVAMIVYNIVDQCRKALRLFIYESP